MATSKQINSEIEQIENAIRPTNDRLDQLYGKFAAALPAYVEKWMREHVRRRIEENADAVNAGGIEPLKQIKADLNDLVKRLPEICREAVGDASTWPHRPRTQPARQVEPRVSESHAAASFRRAISPVADLLAKHGLLRVRSGHVGEWESAPGGGYRYAINPGFDERHFPVLKQYQDTRAAHSKELERLEEKRKELARAQARELWDEA
jgi:hypothetical protein